MGRYDFTPEGMRNAAMREPCYYGGSRDDDYEQPIIVNIVNQTPTESRKEKNSGEELKDLLASIKDMSPAEKRFAIKAHYGLLTEADVDSIV